MMNDEYMSPIWCTSTVKSAKENTENNIMKFVHSLGINVDKEELIKALSCHKALDKACDYLSDTTLIMVKCDDGFRKLTKEEWKMELMKDE